MTSGNKIIVHGTATLPMEMAGASYTVPATGWDTWSGEYLCDTSGNTIAVGMELPGHEGMMVTSCSYETSDATGLQVVKVQAEGIMGAETVRAAMETWTRSVHFGTTTYERCLPQMRVWIVSATDYYGSLGKRASPPVSTAPWATIPESLPDWYGDTNGWGWRLTNVADGRSFGTSYLWELVYSYYTDPTPS